MPVEGSLPKLKWANIVSSGGKARSLLDIQAEEESNKQEEQKRLQEEGALTLTACEPLNMDVPSDCQMLTLCYSSYTATVKTEEDNDDDEPDGSAASSSPIGGFEGENAGEDVPKEKKGGEEEGEGEVVETEAN